MHQFKGGSEYLDLWYSQVLEFIFLTQDYFGHG